MNRCDLAVVGSGIVGLGAAYAAAKRGLRVVVVDRTDRPVGSTIRNFGHLCIGAQSGLAREFGDTSRGLWLQLAQEASFWIRESGTLIAARHDDEIAVLEQAALAGGVRMLDAAEMRLRAPLRADGLLGGALINTDLQTDPRTAATAIVRYLTALGVEFRFRTSVTSVASGRVETSRGPIDAGQIVVAVNHDVDQLLPEIAERVGVVRCALDMMRIAADMPTPLSAPLLTGWSLIRYGRFSGGEAGAALRQRLHSERPELAALDLNQMYTQLPDGSLIVGDSHAKGVQPDPFQPEAAFDAFLEEARSLLDVDRIRVIERWQGIYASGPREFLIESVDQGVLTLAATTGIGMTTGLGLAEHTLSTIFDWAPQPAEEGAS